MGLIIVIIVLGTIGLKGKLLLPNSNNRSVGLVLAVLETLNRYLRATELVVLYMHFGCSLMLTFQAPS